MKRVKSACILQTLIFAQKPELNFSKEYQLTLNREELENYKATLERAKTRYIITAQEELEDGSIVIHIKKQYSDKVDVSEYFDC